MATEFMFNGRRVILPGVYATIKSGIKNPPAVGDYGTVLIIDTGLGATWGGGAGIDGELAHGSDAVYAFNNIYDYKAFVKGGKFWKLAEPLFKPRGAEPGVSLLYHVKAATTTSAVITFDLSAKGTFTAKVRDEGIIGNGVIDDESQELVKGYAFTVETGEEDPDKFMMKFWVGTYKGAYPSDDFLYLYGAPIGADIVYDEVLGSETEPVMLCKSDEFNTMAELLTWARASKIFAQYFALDEDNSVTSETTILTGDVSAYADYTVATGGTETYSTTALSAVLEAVRDLDYVFILSDKYGVSDYNSTEVGMILSHIESEAKYTKFLVYGAGYDDAEFWGASGTSQAVAGYFDSERVIVVHGGIKKASAVSSTGFRDWDAQMHAAYLLGRLCGLPPQVPLTFKPIGIEGLVHNLTERQREQALRVGILTTYFDSDFNDFVCLKGVNSLQNNTNLVNPDGKSHSVQVMRIVAQVNHDLTINAKLQLLGQPEGVNRNTLSPTYIKNWTEAFLETKVATSSQDNLILSFRDVTVTRQQDSYWVSYAIVINNEIDKAFFTGFLVE